MTNAAGVEHVVEWHYSTKELKLIPLCMPRRKTRPKWITTTAKKNLVDCAGCIDALKKEKKK